MINKDTAKELQVQNACKGILIIYCDRNGRWGSASWGTDRKWCAILAKIGEIILERINSGSWGPKKQ
jgi:hypothetical protein